MTTLRDALRLLETRDLTTVELIDEVIARLEATEPRIHAWVSTAHDEARIAALRADELRGRTSEIPPLLGIPVGIKDIFDIAGQPTRCNSRLFDDVAPATRTAWSVTSLLRDGVTVLGKTVTQEFAAGVVSAPARNPWNPDRIPGGSSGGSAAAVAAGACTFALGTDTGGSIRIPASLTGTVGLKPTLGTIPTRGVFPLSTSLDTVGPISQTVADAMIAWRSLRRQGEWIADTIAALDTSRSLAGRRIGLLGGHFATRVQPDVLAAMDAAADVLTSLGAEVVRIAWADAAIARATGLTIQRVEASAVHATALRESADLIGEDLRSRLEVGALISGADYIDALKAREAVKASIEALYRDRQLDAAIAPATAATAPRADAPGIAFDDGVTETFGIAMTRLTTPWNATGQPVISVPCGFDRDDLPIGLAVIGKPYDEMTIAAIAHTYEQATAWHSRRPMTATMEWS